MRRIMSATVRGVAVVVLMVAATAAACQPPPPPPPPPELPDGIGVAWLQDAGGTIVDFPERSYQPAFERWVTMDGTTSGPTPLPPGPLAINPFPATFSVSIPDLVLPLSFVR